MNVRVKICGITDLDTALFAASFGADAIGFVFAESKRKIDPHVAHVISERLPQHIQRIGVFVNETRERIEEIVKIANLTMVQLHGDESYDFCESISVPVIKAFGIHSEDDLVEINKFPCEWILLDSPIGKYRGGNGKAFNWSMLAGHTFPDKKIILAGGLDAKNVEDAMRIASPFMVDVSSGVETEGKKDINKIERFIKKAKNLSSALKDSI
jgi:phosphoribosylanthranilate isomerase